MNDKDIIKALECCTKAKLNDDCKRLQCPFFDVRLDVCKYVNFEEVIYNESLNLINRQQAEIEKLTIQKNAFGAGMKVEARKNDDVRAEAIKEFAKRLKEMMFNYYECVGESAKGRPYKGDNLMDYEVVDMIEDSIDNLVKEMLGKEDEE